MRKIAVFVLFLVINFGALAIGGILMGASPVENTWYTSLHQAPWTPPGFVFGIAWTIIMLCFSMYLATSSDFVLSEPKRRKIYIIHLVLNVAWNPVFFYLHLTWLAFPILIGLILTLIQLNRQMGYTFSTPKSWLLFPYFIWLAIAASLNAYIAIMN
jgi:tryptophan-rich sensory protein